LLHQEDRVHNPDFPYQAIDHTADIAVQVRGHTKEELFANAARGMFAQMVDLDRVERRVTRPVQVEGVDLAALLVAWLSELLWLRDVHGEAYADFTIQELTDTHLEAIAYGSPGVPFTRPVKAVTFHGLQIEQRGDEWVATIVFDV
jgi:SHS2 domain-containing protein